MPQKLPLKEARNARSAFKRHGLRSDGPLYRLPSKKIVCAIHSTIMPVMERDGRRWKLSHLTPEDRAAILPLCRVP